ncbi:hypothetical protein V8B97DRAFT_1939889 [Scleroderma yunnanense]
MEWPTDGRQNRTAQDKKDNDHDFWRWPHLDYGSLGRITLVEQDGQLKWSTVVDTTSRRRLTPLGGSTRVFPETRPPSINLREHSTRKRSEQGLQYLRTYFPDADFPSDLVQDEVVAQAKESNGPEPSLGNLLELSPLHHTENAYNVLFPMGDLNNELNVSSLVPSTSGKTIFKASGVASFTFDTPILQLSSSALSSHDPNTALVRTYTSVSLIRISPEVDGPHKEITRDIDLTRSHTGDIPIVDSRILGAGPDIVTVNRIGHVYKCNVYAAGKAMQMIEGSRASAEGSQAGLVDYFWQLGATNRNDECFLTSRTSVKHLDFRSSNNATVIYSLDNPREVVTSYETPGSDHLSRVTTTGGVVWLDDRYPRKPLLEFKHHRGHDVTLKILTVQLTDGPKSLLTSRKNGLVTVYDVGRSMHNLVHCNSTPVCLPWDKPMFTKYTGLAVVPLACGSGMSLLRLTEQGGIHRQDIGVTTSSETEDQPTGKDDPAYEWNADVQELDRKAKNLSPYFGPVAGRHFTEVDLRAAYERIFALRGNNDNDSDEDFCAKLSRFPSVWEQTEVPFEGMLTMLDVVTHVAEESKIPAWADFFAGCIMDHKQSFRALMRGDLSCQDLASRAPWHHSILDTVRHLPYEISSDWSTFHEWLKKLESEPDGEKSTASLQRRSEAREHVVVDLALSCDVFSPQPIVKPSSMNTKPAAILGETSGDSVPEEPPEVQFGYFRPIRKVGVNHYTNAGETSVLLPEESAAVSSPLGVRLLLSEWQTGVDVENYVYHDPYNTTESVPIPAPPRRKQALPTSPPVPQIIVASKRRPPAVMTAAPTQPPWELFGTRTVEYSHSQGTAFNSIPDSSQELMTSTQVLPGPHGGRPVVGKKKVAKKRMGGF